MGGVARSVGKVVSSVLGIEQPQQQAVLNAPPAIEPPPPMPVPDDAAARAAQRKSVATQRKRQGRASTIFTAADEGLGG